MTTSAVVLDNQPMDAIWAAIIGLIGTIVLEGLGFMVAFSMTWGKQSQKISDLEKQVNNDVLGRKAIKEHGETLAGMAKQISAIHEKVHSLPCEHFPSCLPSNVRRVQQ